MKPENVLLKQQGRSGIKVTHFSLHLSIHTYIIAELTRQTSTTYLHTYDMTTLSHCNMCIIMRISYLIIVSSPSFCVPLEFAELAKFYMHNNMTTVYMPTYQLVSTYYYFPPSHNRVL